MTRTALALFAGLALSACGGADKPAPDPAATPAAPPAPATPTASVGDFDALGTEPFWAVKVRAETLVLMRPDHAEMTVAAPAPSVTGQTMAWRTAALDLSITPGDCSDGMSDRRYPYAAQVRINGEVMKGCAFKAGERPSEAPGS